MTMRHIFILAGVIAALAAPPAWAQITPIPPPPTTMPPPPVMPPAMSPSLTPALPVPTPAPVPHPVSATKATADCPVDPDNKGGAQSKPKNCAPVE